MQCAPVDFGFLEARDLARGSGGGEGARERHEELLADSERAGGARRAGRRPAGEANVEDGVRGEGVPDRDGHLLCFFWQGPVYALRGVRRHISAFSVGVVSGGGMRGLTGPKTGNLIGNGI